MADEPNQPPPSLALTEEDSRQIIEKLRTFPNVATCPICSTQKWTLGELVILPIAARPDHSFPLVPIICDTCGNTMLLNLIVLGVPEKFVARLREAKQEIK